MLTHTYEHESCDDDHDKGKELSCSEQILYPRRPPHISRIDVRQNTWK